MPNSIKLSMEFFLLMNAQMQTIVRVSAFMSRKICIIGLSEHEKTLNLLLRETV